MALRLRKDVQKASYYVWFLGAQEAKALRGTRTLLPMIPRMVEKSKEQEPLKVTLQVSHKGLKIVQGSAKHFIPHGAITCSVQTEDIVACTLLLYNPATKCPLHVHAYRCDSELTAQALHDQLQVLINRPENQKRFTELEARLGLAAQLTGGPCGNGAAAGPLPIGDGAQGRKRMPRRFESPRRFPDSSHGSDTGTASTRESECSEEQQHSPTSGGPVSPLISQSKLYDSLAAELREKLSGGVPLLLPAKDPEHKKEPVHGVSDAAARRFRNGCLTGSITPSAGVNQKHGVSSRGSSGIGSDLAPSPERHEPQSSSEDEWVNDQEPALNGSSLHHHPHHAGGRPVDRYLDDQPVTRMSKYREAVPPTTTYLYPNVRDEPGRARHGRSSSREEDRSLQGSVNSREEEVKPIITNHTPRYRNAYKPDAPGYGLEERKKKITIEDGKYGDERDGGRRGGRYPPAHEREEDAFEYGKPAPPEQTRRYFEEEYEPERYRDSLTDRQKYRGKEYGDRRGPSYPLADGRYADGREDYRDYSPERLPVSGRSGGSKYTGAQDHFGERREDFKVEREAYHRRSSPVHKSDRMRYDDATDSVERRPLYRANDPHDEPGAYREERRAFPSARDLEAPKRTGYKLADKYEERWRQEMVTGYGDAPEQPSGLRTRYHRDDAAKHGPQTGPAPPQADTWKQQEPRKKSVEIRTSSPESTMHRISPKDRFQTAKEKFQQMERERHEQERLEQERLERERLLHSKRAVEHVAPVARRGSLEPARDVSSHDSNGWSSDEELPPPRGHPRSNGSLTGGTNGPAAIGDRPGGYRELAPEERYPGLDREGHGAGRRMMPAKSLTSLVKGYRHSYAEPRPPPVSRSSGRVGLAAVNPY
uniref:PID domain-containing protein n=1 Tax=Anopheles quadriannulatus TaxID=34691 RepID=A0A1I8JVN9_ANOQN